MAVVSLTGGRIARSAALSMQGKAVLTAVSAEIDLTVLGATVTLMETIKGRLLIPACSSRFLTTLASGVQTNTPQYKAGTNANHDNWFAATVTPTTSNWVTNVITQYGTGAAGGFLAIDLSNGPLVLEVSLASTGTGSFANKGRFLLSYHMIGT